MKNTRKTKKFVKVVASAMLALLMLVAACSCSSKDAWPVDKETALPNCLSAVLVPQRATTLTTATP